MKAVTALFFCALLSLSCVQGAVVVPVAGGLLAWISCITSGTPCSIFDIFGSIDITDDLDLSPGILTITPGASSSILINSSLNANSIKFGTSLLLTSSVVSVASGAVVALGSTLAVGANSVIQIAGAVTVSGVTTVASGAAFIANSGSYVSLNGGINVDAGASTTNQGLLVNNGASLTIGADSNINGNLKLDTNSTLFIQNAVVTSANSISAAGSTTIQGTLSIAASAGSYTQTTGALILASTASAAGTVDADVNVNANAYLRGNGNVTGALAVSGTISVGNSPGTVYCKSYSMTSTSTFELEIASSSSYDQVISRGDAQLDGILKGILLNNYVPSTGEKYTFITAIGTVSGKFNIVTGNTIATVDKYSYVINTHTAVAYYNNNGATVGASLLLMFIAFALVSL